VVCINDYSIFCFTKQLHACLNTSVVGACYIQLREAISIPLDINYLKNWLYFETLQKAHKMITNFTTGPCPTGYMVA